MSRTLIVGDVHGCLDELETLLDKLKPSKEDTLIFLGDLVDKGPRSADVVRLVHSLSNDLSNVTLIMGNHEEKHRRWWHHVQQGKGRERKLKDYKEIEAIQKDLNDDERFFLFSEARLWSYVDVHSYAPLKYKHLSPPVHGLVVHGGVPKELEKLPFDFSWQLTARTAENKRRAEIYERMLRIRYVDKETGVFVATGAVTDSAALWPVHYDGRFGMVYYGHHAYVKATAPVVSGHTTGLDLGCVYGNLLCAAVFHDHGQKEYVTVSAKKAYAEYWFDNEP